MRAILLAAGRGKRLGRDAPKCLLWIDGKTLLQRHLENMVASGIEQLTMVVGFQHEKIEQALRNDIQKPSTLNIDLVYNDKFVHGSILSLHVAAESLRDGAIWMDADVLYPAALLRRLVTSQHDNCVLLDARSQETGEEMMVGVRQGRVLKVARRVGQGWDLVGETVGFSKVGQEGAKVMRRLLAEEVAAGRIDQEYEAAMDRAFQEIPFGYERVDEFSWTEIDFEEDVEKATGLVKSL